MLQDNRIFNKIKNAVNSKWKYNAVLDISIMKRTTLIHNFSNKDILIDITDNIKSKFPFFTMFFIYWNM